MRRHDSGWRDTRLPLVHESVDLCLPLPGMSLLMVEYDNGGAVGLINYVRRDDALSKGQQIAQAFNAVGRLRGPMNTALPFLTARYDPRNWAMMLFPHNDAARCLLGCDGWLAVTEEHFIRLLYRLRERTMPNLSRWNVEPSTGLWLTFEGGMSPTAWPGQDMSVRRRAYEPEGGPVPFLARNPCADVDLVVIGGLSNEVTLLVDYKLNGAKIDPTHYTHRAMTSLRNSRSRPVPSMIVRYDPAGDRWTFHVYCLNRPADTLLAQVMKGTNAVAPGWWPKDWTYMDAARWFGLLDIARDA